MNRPTHLYHIFPLGALRREATGQVDKRPTHCHNLRTLEQWIPHLQDLRIDTLLLGPVFQSETHGYDCTDQRQVDNRLGSWDDLAALIRKLHAEGIKVVLDAVWSHTSRQHFAYQDILKNGTDSAYADWYENLRWGITNRLGDPFTVDCWDGHEELPKLNLNHPEVQTEILSIASLWIHELGIDGVRIDAADTMDRQFLARLSDHCHALKRDFWMLGEVVFGDYRLWLEEGKLDSITNYEGYKSLWSSFNDGNLFEIAYSLNRLSNPDNGIYKDYKLLLFNENHDVSRIASVLHNRKHLYPLHLMHYTIPGIPSLYYGEEWGYSAQKENKGDWNLRPQTLNVPPEHIPEPHLLPALKRFVDLYFNHIALREGAYRQVYVSPNQLAYLRIHEKETLLVVINAEETEVNLTLRLNAAKLTDILNTSEARLYPNDGIWEVKVPNCWGSIYTVDFAQEKQPQLFEISSTCSIN
ncbi:MAG: alpha-glucosidase C-terminal domain-containing protein [Opitutales bacterium]|nr:alpha-glucosidase C-terminal domain-containing protein [Opitutales bacterium]